ncbi:MAG: hypothetical protein K1X53_09045 [Candidatus Sumerlaeaceae bacterium]|nr:hypothetical protein [Candidatus Sumerlaeaceae bacterium]
MSDSSGRDYGEWIGDLLQNPASCGAKGWFFYLAALPILIICGLLGLAIFRPGTYPKIVLIAPGLILGAIVITIYGWILYKLPAIVGILLSLVIAVPGYMISYNFVMELFGGLRRAF